MVRQKTRQNWLGTHVYWWKIKKHKNISLSSDGKKIIVIVLPKNMVFFHSTSMSIIGCLHFLLDGITRTQKSVYSSVFQLLACQVSFTEYVCMYLSVLTNQFYRIGLYVFICCQAIDKTTIM